MLYMRYRTSYFSDNCDILVNIIKVVLTKPQVKQHNFFGMLIVLLITEGFFGKG